LTGHKDIFISLTMQLQLEIFRALADPTRVRIMALLRAMELSVGELAQVLAQSQPRVSRHIKILCDAGLARRRKEGSWVFLCPGDKARTAPLYTLLDQWSAIDGPDLWAAADAARLTAVRADRAAAAETWFNLHAQQWDAIRSLHVPETAVEAAIEGLLVGRDLGRLVDIGTGTGRMLALLGATARSATGIDRSPEMLRLARAKLSEMDGLTFDLQQGDITRLSLPEGSADTVIVHQVLHYLPAPELAIREARRILDPGGRLVIVDFAPHDHEELRSRDAHARLGFSDTQMAEWFGSAGLKLTRCETLAGGDLTVKLWLGEPEPAALLKMVR
jgi:ubiquinone/menaquinone biosynthesis C-methylase UbiE